VQDYSTAGRVPELLATVKSRASLQVPQTIQRSQESITESYYHWSYTGIYLPKGSTKRNHRKDTPNKFTGMQPTDPPSAVQTCVLAVKPPKPQLYERKRSSRENHHCPCHTVPTSVRAPMRSCRSNRVSAEAIQSTCRAAPFVFVLELTVLTVVVPLSNDRRLVNLTVVTTTGSTVVVLLSPSSSDRYSSINYSIQFC